MPKPSLPVSRRDALKTVAATTLAVPTILPKNVFGANDKINLAWVGFGNMGWGDLNNCAHGNNVVALCDVDPSVYAKKKAGEKYPGAKFYKDFRVMLEEMDKDIDAVGVGTPDHTHFAITYMAMHRGKHVFVEKPLVHSLWEARTLQKLAKEKKVVTQMGNQGHAFEGAYLVKEWVEAGLIGDVKEVITWTDRPKGGWGFSGKVRTAYPKPGTPPEGMDWDLWLGPCTKEIGFSTEFHVTRWRPWWDFGCGGLGDIGCHTIDTPYWALGLGAPEKVTVDMAEEANDIHTPNGSVVHYHFGARGDKPPVKLSWYEGPTKPKAPEGYDWPIKGSGGLIMVGEGGKGICHDGMRPNSPRLYPQAKWQEYRENPDKRVPKTLKRVRGIHKDWVDTIRNGGTSVTDFGYSAPLTETIILGTLAIRTGKDLAWHPENLTIKGNDAANALVNVEAREGWRVQDLT